MSTVLEIMKLEINEILYNKGKLLIYQPAAFLWSCICISSFPMEFLTFSSTMEHFLCICPHFIFVVHTQGCTCTRVMQSKHLPMVSPYFTDVQVAILYQESLQHKGKEEQDCRLLKINVSNASKISFANVL